MACALLRQICRADADYPDNHIHSLYFDTPDLDQYQFSQSGELRKNKVRVRWYDEVKGETMPVFLELKSREGFASSKQRARLIISSAKLDVEALPGGILERTLLNNTLAGFSFFPAKPLRPVIYISYRRYRFNDLSSGIRVSLDFDIRGRAIASEIGGTNRSVRLAGAVIEIKGTKLELPPTLRRLKILDTDWTRFSKYSNCIDACLAEPGSVADNWPSGKTNLR